MKKEKGFTLIELLAVIVILAIIALIATPIVMNVIEQSRKESFKNSAYGLVKAIEHSQLKNFMEEEQKELTFTYIDRVEIPLTEDTKLDYRGEKPKSGAITINAEGKVALALSNGTYCVVKDFDVDEITFSNQSETDCTLDNLPTIPNEYTDGSGASVPELSTGMIPVRWNGTSWIKADTKNEWYNYDNKEWANAVLVSNTSRNSYQSDEATGQPVNETDILAYLVWIPRYRYELFNVNATVSVPQLIEIEFENKNDSSYQKASGSTNGTYLTHPAFTWKDVNENDLELSGIWVGKFETTGTEETPTVKPTLVSLTGQNISTQFATSQKFSNTNTYGLTNTNDSHMMKNMEWGAVSYLTVSKYGQGLSEVFNNNSANLITGCAGNTVSALSFTGTSDTGCENDNTYNTIAGQRASTTGNIYGIYDMSGGAWEAVMAYIEGEPRYSGFTTFPDVKYYDSYAGGTTHNTQEAYNRLKLGDATGETRGWNGDFSNFVFSNFPWFLRGGRYDYTQFSGILAFYYDIGTQTNSTTFRLVVLGDA